MKVAFVRLVLCTLCAVFFPAAVFGRGEPYFPAYVRVGLCPEFLQGAEIELEYYTGAQADPQPLPIEFASIDEAAGTGTFYFSLPAVHGTMPLRVFAFCRGSEGRSPASNEVALTNCDALSKIDSDFDGLHDDAEDRNCDNSYSPGDYSNPDNADSDGDGARDLVELFAGTDPANPGSGPRPFIASGHSFDPDNDGNANPVAWRIAEGMWFVRDFGWPGNHIAFQFGLPGDIPFVYRANGFSDAGVIRILNRQYLWLFRGPGFGFKSGERAHAAYFGLWGDSVIPGPWENAQATSPAVARLYQGVWYFFILLSDGTFRIELWGGAGDLPKVQDYDGDGLFDIAVYRPSEGATYVIHSADRSVGTYHLGTGTADHTFRGDIDADGKDDLTFWEPSSGLFTSLSSRQPNGVTELQLGLYSVHLPLSWNRQGGMTLFTVVDHAAGVRYMRPGNDPAVPVFSLQWGLPGDALG